MSKRIISLIICGVFVLLQCAVVLAQGNLLIGGGFEDGEMMWSDFTFSDENAAAGKYCAEGVNPEGGTHRFDYSEQIFLEEGVLYRVSMMVRAGDGGGGNPSCGASFSHGENRVTINVKNVPGQWQEVVGYFVMGESGGVELSLKLYGATVFYVDNLSLTELGFTPVSMDLYGPRNILIPKTGSLSYEYSAVIRDRQGNMAPVMGGETLSATSLPTGVTFEDGVITVDSGVLPGSMINLKVLGMDGASDTEVTVLANNNHIVNGAFEDLPRYSGWKYGDFEIEDGAGRVTLHEHEDNVHTGSITAEDTVFLESGKMYVFRARVKTTAQYGARQVIMPPPQVRPDGSIDIFIQNATVDWTRVFSVIRVPWDGKYKIKINFNEAGNMPVMIDDIGIYEESPRATDAIFSAPAHISRPEAGEVRVNVNFAVRDQEGNILAGEPVTARVMPENAGVYLDGKTLVVTSGAGERNYKIHAASDTDDNVYGEHTVVVSSESVGDGGFENYSPGQWWTSAPPSKFNIVSSHGEIHPSEGVMFGRLTFGGNVSALLCDSYKKYTKKAYVFEADMIKTVPDIETVVTVIIDNAASDDFEDNLIAAQFTLSPGQNKIRKVFVPKEEIDGRLMIGFTTPPEHDMQVVLIDNVKMEEAAVAAGQVRAAGQPYVDMLLTGRYQFSSNFDTADTSSYRWLVSSAQNGAYVPIDGQNKQTLEITADLVNKYVKFEVTPASLDGPVYGASAVSDAVRIQAAPSNGFPGGGGYNEGGDDEPALPDIPEVTPDELIINRGGQLSIYNIYKVTSPYELSFYDMKGHWAENDVRLMAGAGIANGRGGGLFMPSEMVTRAEFSAFIVRSFALAPLPYTGRFSDVEQWEWYSGIIETVTKYDIARGTGGGKFSPQTPITREQMAVMIMRAYEKTGSPVGEGYSVGFEDAGEVSGWASESVKNAAGLGIILGSGDGKFWPQRNATRAEVVTVIKRMITVMLEKYGEIGL